MSTTIPQRLHLRQCRALRKFSSGENACCSQAVTTTAAPAAMSVRTLSESYERVSATVKFLLILLGRRRTAGVHWAYTTKARSQHGRARAFLSTPTPFECEHVTMAGLPDSLPLFCGCGLPSTALQLHDHDSHAQRVFSWCV